MADRGDTHYHLPLLNRWFAVSSIILLGASVWMVIDDWSRPWKAYQREFQAIEVERARETLLEPEAQKALSDEKRLQAAQVAAKKALDANKSSLLAAETKLKELLGTQFVATEAEKKAKQNFNWERWAIEEHRIKHGDPGYAEDRLKAFEDELFARGKEKQIADAAVDAQNAKIDEFTAQLTDAEAAVRAATKEVDLVRKKLATLAPDDFPTQLANIIRDFPGLDFIGPSLVVNKVVLENLTFELNFTKKKRIDMCTTCHVPIERAGFEDEAQPFTSHPRLDLFLSAKSPHSLAEMGCTICHRGSGEALDFVRADHNATDEAEGDEWAEEYHWHKKHYWDYPMLNSEYIEASCVQCHTDSMELIADDAPKVTEGYRLFESYGCYSCHKVEWFPTKRRPGPSLRGIQSKTNRDFVSSWIAKPRDFRPTTKMPQIFHLENYAPDEVIAVSEWGSGPPILGQAWNETAVAAVTAYLWDVTQPPVETDLPVEGDPVRGREVFRLSGCLACHNMAPHTEAEQADVVDPAKMARETNEHGPNLRGIATKVTPEWLYGWVKDPTAYWPETRMPNLRLSDQDAADVVAYVFEDPESIFTDVPDGWEATTETYDQAALREQARWFFNRTARSELTRRFQEEWSDDKTLLVAVGEKYVLNQGCHSCHEIPGLENAMPIGAELTTWASKTVDKLDWGFMHEIIAEEADWPEELNEHKKLEMKYYREPWLEQKLHAPRSFDRRKVKNPTEKLRMPWFDFEEDEVKAIATFVVGLVKDEVQHAKMVPSAPQVSMNHGLQTIRQKNCQACHMFEPGSIEFTGEDGRRLTAHGQFINVEDETLPPPFNGFQDYISGYEDYIREVDEDPEYELEDVAFQLVGPHPELGKESGSTIVVEDIDSIETKAPWGGAFVDIVADYYLRPWGYDPETDEEFSLTGDPEGEGRVQDVDGEWRDYSVEPYPKIRWTFAPPVLWDEGSKIQREWFYAFLKDPEPLRQQMRVRMPTFSWEPGEAEAVVDYFMYRSEKDWPARYAKEMFMALGKTPDQIANEMSAMGMSGVSAGQVEGIAAGGTVETEAGLSKLVSYGDAKDFDIEGPITPTFEAIEMRSPSYLDPLLARNPEFFDNVHRLADQGPNCFQCHFLQGGAPTAEGPIAWAPDLFISRERLRVGWTREWLNDPGKKYPGTSMPANFPPNEAVYQEFLPGTSQDQIEAILAWLFNLDLAAVRN